MTTVKQPHTDHVTRDDRPLLKQKTAITVICTTRKSSQPLGRSSACSTTPCTEYVPAPEWQERASAAVPRSPQPPARRLLCPEPSLLDVP